VVQLARSSLLVCLLSGSLLAFGCVASSSSGGTGGAGGQAPDTGLGGAPGSGGTPERDLAPELTPVVDATVEQAGDPPSVDSSADVGLPEAAAETAAGSCPAGALLCDDFEKYTAGGSLAPTWTTDLTGGMVRVDTTKPFAGKQAVHISAATGVTNLLQIVTQGAPVFPLPGNMFYGRMMYWLSEMPPDHTNIIQASGVLPGGTQIAKYAYGIKYKHLMAGYTIRARETDSPTVDCGNTPATTGYPEKKWICLEWQFDGSKDEMHHWVDGQAQPAVDVVKTGGCPEGGAAPANGRWQAPVFNKVMLGFYAHPYATPIDVWIDDVVISTQRIGCPPPP
jgi:hypothetical protein